MKILYFAPIATNKNLSYCPFITQRVVELQKQGVAVITLQSGNLQIGQYGTGQNRKGLHKLWDFIRNICLRFRFFQEIFQHKKCCHHPLGIYYHYEKLHFLTEEHFVKWYRRHNFDLIHLHFLGCAGQLPALSDKYGIKYVVTVHGSDLHEEVPFDNIMEINRALSIFNNSCCNIFVSKFLLDYAKKIGYAKANYRIIHNGVDPKVFYPSNIENEHDYYIGFVGHPITVKRAEILPHVLAAVRNVLPNTRMLILGSEENDLIPQIKELAKRLGVYEAIDFVSSVSPNKVGDYMRQLDVLLFPSRNEGFGCVAIEAQMCGVGVVGSSNGGIPEAIGKNGIIVPESENFTKDFASAVIDYLNHPLSKDEVIQNVGDCSWHNCVAQEIHLYTAVIDTPHQ